MSRLTGKRIIGLFMAVTMVVSAVALPFASNISDDDSSYAADADGVHYDEKLQLFYSDEFFINPSNAYNSQLATRSMQMANNSIVLGNPSSKSDTAWYEKQPNRISDFFKAIGFTDFDCNDDYRKPTAFDTIGVAVAKKQIEVNGKQYTLVGVAVRSGGYFNEWANNVWLGTGDNSDSMHEGWYNAALKVDAFVTDYILKNNITGDIKLWASGFSRGGATVNLFAGLLDNLIDGNKPYLGNNVNLKLSDVYAYTFEAPQGASIYSKHVKAPGDAIYCNIWNIVEPNDLVPKVAMSGWGFTRFGTDVFITTQFYDAENFKANREVLSHFYGKESIAKADRLLMYGIPGGNEASLYLGAANVIASIANPMPGSTITALLAESSSVLTAIEPDKRKVGYDGNIVVTLILEELTKNLSRSTYCQKFQSDIRDVLLIFMDDISTKKDAVKSELFSTLILTGVLTVIGGEGAGLITMLIKNSFNSADTKKVESTAMELVPTLKKVYNERPNELVTLAMNIKNIFENHNSDLIVAHMKAQDSLHIDRYNKDPSTEKEIQQVPLRDTADFARAVFDTYNSVKFYLDKKAESNIKVNMEGFLIGPSKVHRCDAGYAVGYYSYATGEKAELFFNVDEVFAIEYESFSKKMWEHKVTYDLYYQHFCLGEEKVIKERISSFSQNVHFGAGPETDYTGKTPKEMLGHRAPSDSLHRRRGTLLSPAFRALKNSSHTGQSLYSMPSSVWISKHFRSPGSVLPSMCEARYSLYSSSVRWHM